jgi:uncharacterized protein GlcG (DUF336 family)
VKKWSLGLVGFCLLGTVVFSQTVREERNAAVDAPAQMDRAPIGERRPNTPIHATDADAVRNQTTLRASDVQAAIQTAAGAVSSPLVIAVTTRQGEILGVYRKANAPTTAIGNFGQTVDANELAVGLARTASFFSNDAAPLTSRTVRFISEIHFPAGVLFSGPAPLYGIENTNRGCPFNAPNPKLSADGFPFFLPPARSIDGTKPGLGIQTGKADLLDSDPNAVNPGGIPLFMPNGAGDFTIVGGIGVVGPNHAVAEFAAAAAAVTQPFALLQAIAALPPGRVIAGGVSLPEINQLTNPNGANDAGSMDGSFVLGPLTATAPAPELDLIQRTAGSLLTLDDVNTIVNNAIATANQTRAVIRLPPGNKARFVISIADLDGHLIANYRMRDATIFSIDVSVAKARNVIYFTQHTNANMPGVPDGTAVTNRTIEFGAMPYYPPPIDFTPKGPWFQLYLNDVANPCTQGLQPANAFQNGIVFFPGSTPLYKNGQLAGGLGVSGDGVDQDDFVTAAGAAGYLPPANIRSDTIFVNGVRLPFQKFPRDPTDF